MHGNEVFQRVREALALVECERNVRVRERQPRVGIRLAG